MQKFITILVLLSLITVSFSCKKNPAKKYKGNYYFTVQAACTYYHDTTIYYYGSISAGSNGSLTINYSPVITPPPSGIGIFVLGIIYPTVDSDGNLTYSDFLQNDFHSGFTGKFTDDDDVEFNLHTGGLGIQYNNSVKGKRY